MPDGSPPRGFLPADRRVTIRASALSLYPDCMRRTAARLFAPDVAAAGFALRQLPQGIGAATGTACHAAAAFTLAEKHRSGDLGNATEAVDRALASLQGQIEAGVGWDDVTPDRNSATLQVVRQVALYRRQVAPRIVPVTVEERLEAEVTPGVVLSGQVDTTVEGGVRDLKTGVRRRANGFQYGAYALLQRSHGRRVETIIEDFLPRVRIGAEQPPAQEHAYDVAEAERATTAIIRRMADDHARFVETGDPYAFLPNPNSVLCSDRWCPAWGTGFCRAHRGV